MHGPEETITALATPPGEGALAVIRISGSRSLEALRGLAGDASFEPEPRHLHFLELRDGDEILDQVMAAWLPGPRSYTGEDSVEIYAHGGALAARGILSALERRGLRPAEAGEFSYRAFLNGRMDLMQAEAVAELIHSRGEAARRLALGHLEGALSRTLAPLLAQLRALLRDVELGIDFVEEDVEFLPEAERDARVASLLADTESLLEGARAGRVVREGLDLVLAGSPNTGKSSLFNALLSEERAIVTAEPGTTRDVLRESWLREGLVFHLHDTAGLREAAGDAESLGVGRSETLLERASLTLWVMDGAREIEADEKRRLAELEPARCLVLANKSDLQGYDLERCRAALPEGLELVSVSALTGDGMDELGSAILERALPAAELEARAALNRRQEARIRGMRERLASIGKGQETELVARELRSALAELEELTGDRVGEAVLDEIFAEFCIGK